MKLNPAVDSRHSHFRMICDKLTKCYVWIGLNHLFIFFLSVFLRNTIQSCDQVQMFPFTWFILGAAAWSQHSHRFLLFSPLKRIFRSSNNTCFIFAPIFGCYTQSKCNRRTVVSMALIFYFEMWVRAQARSSANGLRCCVQESRQYTCARFDEDHFWRLATS